MRLHVQLLLPCLGAEAPPEARARREDLLLRLIE